MPIYEYQCRSCGETFARLQRMGAGCEDLRCPRCDSAEIERKVSAFASSSGDAARPSSAGCGGGSGFT